MKNKAKPTCEVIEELFITGEMDSVDEETATYISQHLKTCAACRAVQQETAILADHLHRKPEADLKADPAIREQLIQQLQQNGKKSFSFVHWIYGLRDLLNRRIPVYQAALAASFVLLIVFFTINMPAGFTPEQTDATENESIELLYDNQRFVFQALQFSDSQKIGINVKEDTMFTRFIYTTM